MLEELPPELPEVDGLELPPLELEGLEDSEPDVPPELDEPPELMPLEPAPPLELAPPLALAPCASSHSERLTCPSWFLSILSNSALDAPDAPLLPPAALLGLLEDELSEALPPADDLLPCDMEGEAPELDEESPAA